MSALFSFKNDQKREILTIISILPYTDGFFGSIFYILGRFAIMPHPLPVLMPPSLQFCQKVAKKLILSDEPGQTNFKKVPKWLDLVEPSVEGKMEKWPNSGHFFWEKGPYTSKNFIVGRSSR